MERTFAAKPLPSPILSEMSHDPVQELAREISETIVDGNWSLPLEDLLSWMEVRREDYYRWAYAAIRKNEASIQDEFNPSNVEELILFLKDLGWKKAPLHFRKEGLYLSGEDLADWVSFFLSSSLSRIHNHDPDPELLDVILSGCRDPADGLDTYIESTFPMEELIQKASGPFLESLKIRDHSLIHSILRREIIQDLQRKVILPDDLYGDLKEKLLRLAIQLNLVDPSYGSWAGDSAGLSEEVRRALKTFGLPENPLPDPARIREKYRELMKKYHPDINRDPGAEEKTRQLIGAWSTLQSAFPEANG